MSHFVDLCRKDLNSIGYIILTILSYLICVSSHPRNTYVLQDTRTPCTCRANSVRMHSVRQPLCLKTKCLALKLNSLKAGAWKESSLSRLCSSLTLCNIGLINLSVVYLDFIFCVMSTACRVCRLNEYDSIFLHDCIVLDWRC